MQKGAHRARCTGGVLTETKNEHREHVFLKFARSDDPSDAIGWQGWFGDNIDKGGKSLTERTVDVLRVCGWKGDDLTDLAGVTANEVEIVVVEDDYKGSVSLKVRYVQEVGTAAKFMPEAMPSQQAKSFAERMKSRIHGERGTSGKKQPGEPSKNDDGDLPF
jgi:hypothetical protein